MWKSRLCLPLLMLLLSGSTRAGPNAGGTLICHDPNLIYTGGTSSYCGLGQTPASCTAADLDLEGSSGDLPKVWKVYAAFPPDAAPRIKALAFGIAYDPDKIVILAHGACIGSPTSGALEVSSPNWPQPDTGTAIIWDQTQTTPLTEAYWFAGYRYNGAPSCFQLRDDPDYGLGGNFVDDAMPPHTDAVAGFGGIGFDIACASSCPPAAVTGACCNAYLCSVAAETACQGDWLGDGTTCAPDPCLPTSSMESQTGRRSPGEMGALPNPSGGPVLIRYQLIERSSVMIEIFNASGGVVRRLFHDPQTAGTHALRWDGRDDAGKDLPGGVYLTRIQTPDRVITGKVTLTR